MQNRRPAIKRVTGICAVAALVLMAGCRQDMHDQPKFVPQRGTAFYPDGRSARPQVEHTVARGQSDEADFYYSGLQNGREVDALPFPATLAVLERGQEQYNVYCTPCHSRVGNGAGMIVQRGYKPAGNFHDAKRLAEPLSHYFYVITNGYGAMPSYSGQVEATDRWAIAAYIRALQLSQNAKQADLPAGVKVEQLTDVAEQGGLPAGFADPWEMPNTAVYAKPPAEGVAPAAAPADTSYTPDASRHPAIMPNGESRNGAGSASMTTGSAKSGSTKPGSAKSGSAAPAKSAAKPRAK